MATTDTTSIHKLLLEMWVPLKYKSAMEGEKLAHVINMLFNRHKLILEMWMPQSTTSSDVWQSQGIRGCLEHGAVF